MDVGARWTYDIELFEGVPALTFTQVKVPIAVDRWVTYLARGRFGRPGGEAGSRDRRTYPLEIAVKAQTTIQGVQSGPGVELAIGEDPLGVFDRAEQVFWSIGDRVDDCQVISLVVTFPSDIIDPSRSYGRESAVRAYYLDGQPGKAVVAEQSPDQLLYIGIERGVPGYEQTECVHLRRTVDPGMPKNDASPEAVALYQGFVEDLWFARAIGLVRLEQRVAGRPSLRWTLKAFAARPAGAGATSTLVTAERKKAQAVSDPTAFFPAEPGCHWRYRIELGEAQPLAFQQTRWPVDDSGKWTGGLSRYSGASNRPDRPASRTFFLEYRVKGSVKVPTGSFFVFGVEPFVHGAQLEVLVDELGIYAGNEYPLKEVIWAIHEDGRVSELRIHDSRDCPDPTFSGRARDGTEGRFLLFAAAPGTSESVLTQGKGKEPFDKLTYLALDPSGSRMSFSRRVALPKGDRSVGFVEEAVYERGRGLVSLVQKVDGTTSMTWTLESFDRARAGSDH